MTLALETASRNAMCDALVDLVDAGTTDANGDLVIRDSSNTELAVLAFSDPAFGDAASGVANANTITDDTNTTAGTADNFIVRDKDNTTVFSGTVTATGGGGDLELDTLTITVFSTVAVSSFNVTVPAS